MASKEERERISQYVDVSSARLSDDDIDLLDQFINSVGNTFEKSSTHDGWSSDGRFTRKETDSYYIESDYSITHTNSYRDDDGQTGDYSQNYSDARSIINVLKENPGLL